jgi:hypothetical protein
MRCSLRNEATKNLIGLECFEQQVIIYDFGIVR